MIDWDSILNWELLEGSHKFPGPDGGTCINEAAIIAAGLEYRAVGCVAQMPTCFCRVIAQYALSLNDLMSDGERQRLLPFVTRLAGTRGGAAVERQRAELLAMRAVNVFAAEALRAAGMLDEAARCEAAKTLDEAAHVANDAANVALTSSSVFTVSQRAAARQAARAASVCGEGVTILAASDAAQAASLAARCGADAADGPIWDHAITALDDVLAIGPQAEPVAVELVRKRMNDARKLEVVA